MDTVHLLHEEYVRLHQEAETYAKSSFADFKYLGAIGTVFTWKPLLSQWEPSADTGQILFFGFLAILLIVAVLGIRDLMKQSVLLFYVCQMKRIEEQISLLTEKEGLIRTADRWLEWSNTTHKGITLHFLVIFYTVLIAVPAYFLAREEGPYVWIYCLVALLLTILHFNASRILEKRVLAGG